METQNLHPAAEWALQQVFDTNAVDCTTTVVLKILDGKCKMLPGEKAAIMEIYDVIRNNPGTIFDADMHNTIDMARPSFGRPADPSDTTMQQIHELRVYAESRIPKPTMKKYKAMLRDGLFG